MMCEQSHQKMIDVLYGEELNPRFCFEFFRHLDHCTDCNREYLGLIETRENLAEWNIEKVEEPNQLWANILVSLKRTYTSSLWSYVSRVAAGVLILLGGLAILQSVRSWGGQDRVVSEQRLTETVNDMIVARQQEERRLVGMMLVALKEDLEVQHHGDLQQINEFLDHLQQRYINLLEEHNQNLLISHRQ